MRSPTFDARFVVATAIGCTLVTAFCCASPALAANPAPLYAPLAHGAVASDTPDASAAGAEVLAQGGSAADAAIATALALGVVSPSGSGLGGGGFAVLWDAKSKQAKVLDFREVAPAAATRDMYAHDPVPDAQHPARSIVGGLAVAVPAESAGLAMLHDAYGKLSLAKDAAPAARLARGFYPTRRLAAAIARIAPTLDADDPLRRWMMPGGKPATTTTKVVRPHLADTLVRYGKSGHDAIYEGAIAAEIVQTVRSHGGILTTADLDAYRPLWRDPLMGQFRGREIVTAPPPAGGLTTIEAIQFLDALPALPRGSLDSSQYLHRVAEALTHAFADRARWMGDPAFFPVPTAKLASPAYAKELVKRFSDDTVLQLEQYGTATEKGATADPAHDHGTTHVCVIDSEGNAVALTTTVNLELGSRLETPRSGIILNDQMDDFASAPGKPNGFGLVGAEANSIAPGKRPASSMSPLLVVKDGQVVMCAGGSGGPTIVASTLQAVVAVIDEGADAETAVATPRVYAQWRPERLRVEGDIPEDVTRALAKRGHKIVRMPTSSFAPAVQVILRSGDELEAAADPRKGGVPASPSSVKHLTVIHGGKR
ncbi:MAG: gamma-glutamyltransferase [Polyangia bacterium]